jgi:hypothetical protein
VTAALDYQAFLDAKALVDVPTGLSAVPALGAHLFDYQRDITAWALRRGRAAIFADCGLGKTPMQLEWASHIDGAVLILAPLAVAPQTVREGEKFGIPVEYVREMPTWDADAAGIYVTNYELLDRFDLSQFAGLVLDESSILKSYDGATRTAIIEASREVPFRLACTATPAPNDYMELGNHAEFLGVMSRAEMLAMFFVHDGGETQQWRLKGHAQADFWRWVASWAVLLRKPSDVGYDDGALALPPLEIHQTTVATDSHHGTALVAEEAVTLQERLAARRDTIAERVEACAALVNTTPGAWVLWCALNAESEALAKALPEAVEVRGSMSVEEKERAALWFIGELCLCQPKNAARTTARGPKPIASTSAPTEPSERSSATPAAASYTPPSLSDGRGPSSKSPNTTNGSPRSDSHSVSGPMGLLPTTTGAFSPNRAVAAPSAAQSSRQTTPARPNADGGDSTSTTATPAVGCAVSSVHSATSDSESSATTTSDSSALQCTCGHISGRRILISKSSMMGYGMNWQHCHQMAFVGLSDSWEQYYQAVRRCWRFGQEHPVSVHLIAADREGAVVENIRRKDAQATEMAARMVEHTRELTTAAITGTTRDVATYERETVRDARWTGHLGDCVEVVRELAEASVDFTVFSPPFASLYTYSNSDRDMGNCADHETFYRHFGFLVGELLRVTKPGRLLSFHCMNLPTSKVRDGVIGLRDFRGELIRLFESHGWIYHSEVCIWKDPVTAMQRTKALGLLHKTIRTDSSMSRQGIPDYLVTMRKPGKNPEPIAHTSEEFPVSLWQRFASPVWMDINPTETLQYRSAREQDDERHICPLQLEVIRRAVRLWSNPGDLVLSPFMGIGSEGHVALQEGRRFLGVELKRSYWAQAVKNLTAASSPAQDLLPLLSLGEEDAA